MADLTLAIALVAKDMASGPIGAVGSALGGLGKAAAAPIGALGKLTGALGAVGLAKQGIDAIAGAAMGLAGSLGVGLASEAEQVSAKFNAFTKDAGKTAEIIAQVRAESDRTPFSFAAMSSATAGLMPVAKASGAALMDLVRQAEVLAASNPAEGLEGAAFALREAVSGDFTSVIERFNLPRSYINQLKAEGVPALEIVSRSMKEMGYDMDLVSNMALTGAGKWSTFQDAIDGIRMKAAQPVFDALKGQLDVLSGALGDNRAFLEEVAAAVGTTLAGAITAAGGAFKAVLPLIQPFAGYLRAVAETGDTLNDGLLALPRALKPLAVAFGTVQEVVAAVGKLFRGDFAGALDQVQDAVEGARVYLTWKLQEWGRAFLGWIGPMLPGLLAQLGGLARSVADWFVESRLGFVEQLAGWAAAFLDWIGPLIPPFLVELGNVATALLEWVTEKVPEIAGRLAGWAASVTEWVAPRIPVLLGELGLLAAGVLAWITERAAPLAKRFVTEWVPAAINWVLDAATDLLPKLSGFIDDLLAWVSAEGLPLGKQFVADWVPAAINWVLQAATAIAPKLLGFLTGVLDFAIENGPKLARTFLGEWLPAAIGWVAEAAVEILPKLAGLLATITGWMIGTAVPKLASFAWEMGKAIVGGIWDGLSSLDKMLSDAILGAIRSIFPIRIGPITLDLNGIRIDPIPPIRVVTENIIKNVAEAVTGGGGGGASGGGGDSVGGGPSQADRSARDALYWAERNKYAGLGYPAWQAEEIANEMARNAFGFAQGGSFTVGGSGGVDSQLVPFLATPGERVTVTTPQSSLIDYRRLAEELARAVARELAALTLTVGVDDVHSALLTKQRRNGGLGWAP